MKNLIRNKAYDIGGWIESLGLRLQDWSYHWCRDQVELERPFSEVVNTTLRNAGPDLVDGLMRNNALIRHLNSAKPNA